jgi:hypothetical protein
MIISGQLLKRLLVNIKALHFSGAIEKKEDDKILCKEFNALLSDMVARSILWLWT